MRRLLIPHPASIRFCHSTAWNIRFGITAQGRQSSRSRRSSSSNSFRSRSEVAASRPEILAAMRGQGGPGSPNALAMKPITRFGEGGGRMRKASACSPPGNCARRLRKGVAWKLGGDCSRAHWAPCSSSSMADMTESGAGLFVAVSTTAGAMDRRALRVDTAGAVATLGKDAPAIGVGGRMGSRNTRRKRTCSPLSAGLRPSGWTSSHSNPTCTITTHSQAIACVARSCRSLVRIQTPADCG